MEEQEAINYLKEYSPFINCNNQDCTELAIKKVLEIVENQENMIIFLLESKDIEEGKEEVMKDRKTIIEELKKEESELFMKMIRLKHFISTKSILDISKAQRILLNKQYRAMYEYHDTLLSRIENLKREEIK